MTTDELVSKSELFAANFVSNLQDECMTKERKQVFFMENQNDLRKCMSALKKMLATIKESEDNSDTVLLERAENVLAKLEETIKGFREELTIKSDVQEEDIVPVITEESISEAIKTNKTTKEIMDNMTAIAEQRKAMSQAPQFNYVLSCDNTISLISALTKEELNQQINAIANQGQYKDIQLFQVQFVPVPLKQKTILSI